VGDFGRNATKMGSCIVFLGWYAFCHGNSKLMSTVWGDCTDIVTLWRQEHSSTAQIGANLGYCYPL